jgi:hypothetical protein
MKNDLAQIANPLFPFSVTCNLFWIVAMKSAILHACSHSLLIQFLANSAHSLLSESQVLRGWSDNELY